VILDKIALKLRQKKNKKRFYTSLEDSITIIVFNETFVIFMMSLAKTNLINECVERFNHFANRKAIMRLTIEFA